MARQPEGAIKDDCRKIAKRHRLLFENVQSKSRNGWPDTVCGLLPRGAGTVAVEFKVPGKEPTEQQWLRIREIRENGGRATWCDCVEDYERIIRGELHDR